MGSAYDRAHLSCCEWRCLNCARIPTTPTAVVCTVEPHDAVGCYVTGLAFVYREAIIIRHTQRERMEYWQGPENIRRLVQICTYTPPTVHSNASSYPNMILWDYFPPKNDFVGPKATRMILLSPDPALPALPDFWFVTRVRYWC